MEPEEFDAQAKAANQQKYGDTFSKPFSQRDPDMPVVPAPKIERGGGGTTQPMPGAGEGSAPPSRGEIFSSYVRGHLDRFEGALSSKGDAAVFGAPLAGSLGDKSVRQGLTRKAGAVAEQAKGAVPLIGKLGRMRAQRGQ